MGDPICGNSRRIQGVMSVLCEEAAFLRGSCSRSVTDRHRFRSFPFLFTVGRPASVQHDRSGNEYQQCVHLGECNQKASDVEASKVSIDTKAAFWRDAGVVVGRFSGEETPPPYSAEQILTLPRSVDRARFHVQ